MSSASIPVARTMGLRDLLFPRGSRLDLFRSIYERCGDLGAFQVGTRRILLISSAPLAYQVLVEHAGDFEKSPALRIFARPLLGDGLLTCSNEVHRAQRARVAAAFQPSRILSYAGTMAAYADQAQARWPTEAQVDLHREMMRLALGIAGKTLFDADVLDQASELGAHLTFAMRHAMRQMDSPVRIPLHWPTPTNLRTRRAIGHLNEVIFRMIAERRAERGDRGDFLSMLLDTPPEMERTVSDTWIRDEAMTIFLAGHETTANALAWTHYLLAQHPEEYSRLSEEADRVLRGTLPTVEDLDRLPYALQVFKEGLRLYPPAYAIGRQAVKETRIGGHAVEAGTIVIICPFVMHRRPDYFSDPERFAPSRFERDAEKRLPRGAFLPFGSGPRNCIGSHFALMEGQVVLSVLAQRVRFSIPTGKLVKPEPLITLRPSRGIPARVSRRGGSPPPTAATPGG